MVPAIAKAFQLQVTEIKLSQLDHIKNLTQTYKSDPKKVKHRNVDRLQELKKRSQDPSPCLYMCLSAYFFFSPFAVWLQPPSESVSDYQYQILKEEPLTRSGDHTGSISSKRKYQMFNMAT